MSNDTMEAPSADTAGASEPEVTSQPEVYDDLVSAYDAILAESQQPEVDSDGTGDEAADAADTDIVVDEDDDAEPVAQGDGWNWQEHASNQIPVKVNGQETLVPLEELRNGYMRQADYTRKTQEVAETQKLAEWAKEFQDRFNSDPQTMVKMLASAVGFDTGEVQTESDPFAELLSSDPELAPVANTLKQQQQMIQELQYQLEQLNGTAVKTQSEIELQRNVELVRREIQEAKSQFEDFDEMAILPIAAQTGLDLKASYLLWKGSQIVSAPTQASTPEQPQKKAEPSAKKQQAAAAVTNTRFSGEPSTDGEQYDSFADLFEIVARTES
jgi:hypothetical protein